MGEEREVSVYAEVRRILDELEVAQEEVEAKLARLEDCREACRVAEAEYNEVQRREDDLRRRLHEMTAPGRREERRAAAAERPSVTERVASAWVDTVWWPGKLYRAVRERTDDPDVLYVLDRAEEQRRGYGSRVEVPITAEAAPKLLAILDALGQGPATARQQPIREAADRAVDEVRGVLVAHDG